MTEEQFEKACHVKRQIERINKIIKIIDKKTCTSSDVEDLGKSLYELYRYSQDITVKGTINGAITDLAQYYDSKFESI